MSHLQLVDPATAEGEARELLARVQRQLGATPNVFRALANAPAALAGFLGLQGGLARGRLDAPTRERIALAVAEANGCDYCLAAHSAVAGKVGLDAAEIAAARGGRSARDPRADAAVRLARALVEGRGEVPAAELDGARRAGLGDGEIVEVVANVALNVLTNFLNKAGRVEIDFPRVAPRAAA